MKATKPLLITFEGVDGSGKSTQCQMVYHHLLDAGYTVHLFREPGGTRISEGIRDILLDPDHTEMSPIAEMLLYFASRNQLISEKVLPALERGEVVLLDRFVDSTLAYQGYGRGLDVDAILAVRDVAIGDLHPDLTVFVDTPLDTAEERLQNGDRDRFDVENQSFKASVREGYLDLAAKEPERYFVVDGRESIQDLKQAIIQRIQEIMDQ